MRSCPVTKQKFITIQIQYDMNRSLPVKILMGVWLNFSVVAFHYMNDTKIELMVIIYYLQGERMYPVETNTNDKI